MSYKSFVRIRCIIRFKSLIMGGANSLPWKPSVTQNHYAETPPFPSAFVGIST